MDSQEETTTRDTAPRPRITNACEACRSAKVRCQASNQLGICRRCLESKRECIFKTGPRKRRPRQSRLSASAPRPPQPSGPGPSKTFTIDIPVPDEGAYDVAEGIEALRLTHEESIDHIVPFSFSEENSGEDEGSHGYNFSELLNEQGQPYQQQHPPAHQHGQPEPAKSVASTTPSLPVGASALSTPPSSVAAGGSGNSNKKSLAGIAIQPQFNVDSANALLETFKTVMLRQFPIIYLPEDVTVATLAKTRPFVLLAVLAASSSTRSLQGHGLYDEEFRKILGLKFVASGERSMELLLGLVIYVAWYPFHLRPKNKQAFQYVRMVVDILIDLELDQDRGRDRSNSGPSPQRLEEIRAYIGSYYQVSNYGTTWSRTPSSEFTAYTSKCCDILEQNSQCQGDRILAWKVRLQRIIEETNDLRRNQRGHSQSESQIDLMLRGMESQLVEWERKLPEDLTALPTIRISFIFARIFISGAPLLKMPSIKLPTLDSTSAFRADPNRLTSVIPTLRAAYDYYLGLSVVEINSFTGIHWSNFILSVILGFRMSFPLHVCPEWDARAARRQINFDEYLERFCRTWGDDGRDSDAIMAAMSANRAQGLDILSASKVVMGVVRKKFLKKIARSEPPLQPPPSATTIPRQKATAATAGTYDSSIPAPSHQYYSFDMQNDLANTNTTTTFAIPPVTSTSSAGIGTSGHSTGSPPSHSDRPSHTCPIFDGTLAAYLPYFDETFTGSLPAGHAPIPGHQGQNLYHQQQQQQQQPLPPHTLTGGRGGRGGGEGGGGRLGSQVSPSAGEGLIDGGVFNNSDLWATMTMDWT